jgi:hypothetical protein
MSLGLPSPPYPLFQWYLQSKEILLNLSVFIMSLGPTFTAYPLFQWYPQSKEILLNLSVKCWNLAFNLMQKGREKGWE